MARGDGDEGGRAGSGVEVFVGAADREIGIGRGEIDGDCAGAVREVPDGEGAGGMGGFGERRHVVQPAGAVIDLRQHQHGDVVGEMVGDILGLDGF